MGSTPDLQSRRLDIRDRATIHLAALNDVHEQGKDEDTDEQDDAPVEGIQSDGKRVGPEGPEEGEEDIDQADDVDGDAPFAETPARRGDELWVGDAAVENAADGHGVGQHESADLEGDDGVESGGGAEVDEGEEHGDDAAEDNGVGWDVSLRVHVADPVGEGKAVVTSKGKGLTSGRGIP